MKVILFDISTAARRQKAHTCANYIYQLETPNWSSATHKTRYGHEIRIGNDKSQAAMLFDETKEIQLRTHYSDGTERGKGVARIKRWVGFRYPNIDETQKDWVKNWVKTHETATIEQLILKDGGTSANLPAVPAWITVITLDELEAMDNFKDVAV